MLYATAADLSPAWVDPEPANVDRLLLLASARVRGATKTAIYQVDDHGAPIDPDVVAAMRDATCAHVAWMISRGDMSGNGSILDLGQSVAIGSASIGAKTGNTSGSGTTSTGSDLVSPASWDILSAAGLTGGAVQVNG